MAGADMDSAAATVIAADTVTAHGAMQAAVLRADTRAALAADMPVEA